VGNSDEVVRHHRVGEDQRLVSTTPVIPTVRRAVSTPFCVMFPSRDVPVDPQDTHRRFVSNVQ
jgi:hypothetical protein